MTLPDVLSRILARPSGNPALEIAGRTLSYGALLAEAGTLAKALADADCGALGVVGVLGARSLTAYAGALSALLAGRGYVPLNPRFPPDRTASMLAQSGTRALIVGREGLGTLGTLLARSPAPMTVLGPELDGFDGLEAGFPGHRFLARRHLPAGGDTVPGLAPPGGAGAIAYLLFTSGSTGTPKGVPVSFGNLSCYVDYMVGRTGIGAGDRTSQTFDLTFDLSVHDLFVTWAGGACLCPLPEAALLAPARFIREAGLSVWFSVPSIPMLMRRTRTLRPGLFPGLRLSLFCGEALPQSLAEAWADAAPRSVIVNLYGPTEATIAITEYLWHREASAAAARHGIVPLGTVFPTQRAALLDEDGALVAGAGRGELCLGGSQVTAGYLDDPGKTARHYLTLPDPSPGPATGTGLWYRTGDLVERDEAGCLYFLGRTDSQIKIMGHRIELQEVDHALRQAAGTDLAVAVPWPETGDGLRGLVGCVVPAGPADAAALLAACRNRLPDYMVPSRIVFLATLPLNSNGKIDRKALRAQLEAIP
jgi:amino acid adenylation domain-containing protein